MSIFIILFLFFQVVSTTVNLTINQDYICNFKYIQFLDPTIEEVKINIKGLRRRNIFFDYHLNFMHDKLTFSQYIPSLELNIFSLIKSRKEVALIVESNFQNSMKVCFGTLSTNFLALYKFEFEFKKEKNSSLDENDSVILPNFVEIPYEKNVELKDGIFIIMIFIVITLYLCLLVLMFCRKKNIVVIKEKEIERNKNRYRYNGNFRKLIENRYKVLKDDQYPSKNEIIDLPKWNSRRQVIKAMREHRLNAKRDLENVKKAINNEIKLSKKSKDNIVIKRADDIPAEKIKNKDSNVEIRGITKFSSKVFPIQKKHKRKKNYNL
ncbi:Hypothetical protein SRAE_1000315900 [Strongyloides ratti]|uniref:Uncharacterized protein n=1 Tax=Strongyloides ratti TaxID=34506 RepID=A0A090L524_STRRB|nr:Hypothetical protein SRAE_1000315900 [Strongyloides ratti]CEF64906.1 Hypothetical protein SRAE_1000315900 [Strongyloides ratti]